MYEFLRKTRHFSSPRKKKRKRLERYGEVMNTDLYRNSRMLDNNMALPLPIEPYGVSDDLE